MIRLRFCWRRIATCSLSRSARPVPIAPKGTLVAAAAYARFKLQVGSLLHETDVTFQFVLGPHGEVVAVKQSRTGTASTELHFLQL